MDPQIEKMIAGISLSAYRKNLMKKIKSVDKAGLLQILYDTLKQQKDCFFISEVLILSLAFEFNFNFDKMQTKYFDDPDFLEKHNYNDKLDFPKRS